MIILFRTSTGEEWNLIMYDCVKEGGYIVSAFYFVSFITITSFIMLNMFIMVILQYYEQYENESNSTLRQFNS